MSFLSWTEIYCQGEEQSDEITDSIRAERPRYIIRVERLVVGDMKLQDTLLITLESFGNTVAGFDLKFGTTSPFVSIEKVLPGEINDSCDWEYFKAVPVNISGKEDYPAVLWQVMALAKITPDTTQPVCFGFEHEASLLKLVVSNEPLMHIPDTTAPIFFFWEDCSDNSLSDASGSSMIISNKVFDYFGTELSDNRELFPTAKGAPRQCVTPKPGNKPVRQIDFHNGGVLFRLDLGKETSDSNGIPTENDTISSDTFSK